MNANAQDGTVSFDGISQEGGEQGGGEAEGFVVDFTNVDENAGFAAVPRGIYAANVDDCSYGLSQSSGNPMWTMKFEIEEGEFAKRKIFFHMVFAASSMPRTKKGLAVIAPQLLAGPFNPKDIADSGILLGTKCRIRVDIRKYQGKDTNSIRDLLPAGEGEGAGGAGSFLG